MTAKKNDLISHLTSAIGVIGVIGASVLLSFPAFALSNIYTSSTPSIANADRLIAQGNSGGNGSSGGSQSGNSSGPGSSSDGGLNRSLPNTTTPGSGSESNQPDNPTGSETYTPDSDNNNTPGRSGTYNNTPGSGTYNNTPGSGTYNTPGSGSGTYNTPGSGSGTYNTPDSTGTEDSVRGLW